jgi:predicted component of type VI protein secretion system
MADQGYQLVVQSGPNQGRVTPLEKNEIFIGRDLGNDLVVNDAEVSRRHARLVLQAGGFVLEDLGSTNGTTVNGQRLLGPYILRPGDVVTLGEHVDISFELVTFDPDATVVSSTAQPPASPPPAPEPDFPPEEPVVAYPAAPTAPPRSTVQPAAQPAPPRYETSAPAAQPAPPPPVGYTPSYTGQVPQEPALEAVPPRRRSGLLLAIILAILLGLACVCIGFLWYVDANALWCNFFSFIPGCP